jgi:hypothetical protein
MATYTVPEDTTINEEGSGKREVGRGKWEVALRLRSGEGRGKREDEKNNCENPVSFTGFFRYRDMMKQLLLLFTVVIFAFPLWAQKKDSVYYIGTLNGTILEEESRAPIKGPFVITASSQNSSITFSADTDSKGNFKIDLPPGSYAFTINGILLDSYKNITIKNKIATYVSFLIPEKMPSRGVRLVPVKD